jgi:thioredoxin-related protein
MFLFKQRTKLFLWIFICVSLLSNSPLFAATEISPLSNIKELSQLAQEKNLPLLILFSMKHCPFCKRIKSDFLVPMLISGDYEDKVIIRELDIDRSSDIIGLSGNTIKSIEFTRKMNISVFPTMIFIDYKGKQLTEKIIGLNTPSLFGGRIDDAIDEANKKLN